MRYGTIALGIGAALLASACSNNDEYVQRLKDATAKADATLIDAVVAAEAQEANGAAVRAALLVDGDPSFSVKAAASEQSFKYRINLSGEIMSQEAASYDGGPCSGSISLAEALAVAEQEAGGEAVAVVPDDDVACAFEIQVLQPDNLWEVKVGKTGAILESEDSDENGTADVD